MLRGIYAAAAGMINQRERLDVVSNNVANNSTFLVDQGLTVF